jgi:transglutaminase-like putative cysteine protease
MSKKMDMKDATREKKKEKLESAVQQEPCHRLPHCIRWGIVVIIVLVFVFLSLYWIPGELHYVITETYTFTGEADAPVYLAVLLPTSGHYQHVTEPEITWPGVWEIRSDGRLDILLMEVDLKAGETAQAVIKYQVDLFQGEARWVGDPVLAEDLAPSEVVQSDDPSIIAQASALAVNGDDRATVRQIFDFTYQHLDLPQGTQINADDSAANALETCVGGCAEHANLMTALSRAAGIPAHPISGLAMPESVPLIPMTVDWNHPAGAHAWVEVYIDDVWQIADPIWSEEFYKRDLLGWTDGKHLAYDTAEHENLVYGSLLAEAKESDGWLVGMSAPMRFVAWSEMGVENMTFKPETSLRKTWDARYLMIFSSTLILLVVNWLIEEDRRKVCKD